MEEEKKLEGLGGWLVLVGLGIVMSPIASASRFVPIYLDIFTTGLWESLTTPGNANYSSLWAPLLIGEMAINAGMVLVWIFIAFLFFSRKKIFSKWYIGIVIFALVFKIVDFQTLEKILFRPDSDRMFMEYVQTIASALIWIPYLLKSKRVKATFIK